MRDASVAYIQEEKRLRGARPRLRAVLSPFELDYGLAPTLGEFDQMEYGGTAGILRMQAGYRTQGAWTSPVLQSHLGAVPGMTALATLGWTDQAGYLEKHISLRTAGSYNTLLQMAFQVVTGGQEVALQSYYQLQVHLEEAVRAWALEAPEELDQFSAYATDLPVDDGYESYACDGKFPGCLEDITLTGEIVLPEGDIIDPGDISVSLAADFAELQAGDNILLVDNRSRQWLPGGGSFYLQEVPWLKKFIKLYHGFELPGGEVEWQLLYMGQIERLSNMAHGWGTAHTARLESADLVVKLLEHKIGVPDRDGQRRPFMRGYWWGRAELTETAEPTCQVDKQGLGSATLSVVAEAAYSGLADATYLVEIETTGEIGDATFRWSKDEGRTWVASGLVTAGITAPVELEDNLEIYWSGGLGADLVAGDRWQLAVSTWRFHYVFPGSPFEAITAVSVNGQENRPGVSVGLESGAIEVPGSSGEVTARVVKDSRTHPVDIIQDILTEVGVAAYIDLESFALARSDTLGYAIGACFENLSAGQAILQITQNCLFDFWVDCGIIRLRAYTGEE